MNGWLAAVAAFLALAATSLPILAQGSISGDDLRDLRDDETPEIFIEEDPPPAAGPGDFVQDVALPTTVSFLTPSPLATCNGVQPGITIFNDSASEVVVKLRKEGRTCRLVLIPSHQRRQISAISSGNYSLQYATGSGWDEGSQVFTARFVGLCRVADFLGFGGGAKATLTVTTGNCIGGRLLRIDEAAWLG